jgi:diguanylate cyclase (GGDEF)-like protein
VRATPARILIVDDEPLMIELIAGIFADEFEILFATNGAQALRIAASERPDLILLDVVMPDIDGFEVCARLRTNPLTADIPVVFITGLGDTEAETRGLALGAMDYIAKPINPPVVRVRVRNQIALKDARDQLTQLAITDGLTGLANRRRFDEVLSQECARHVRSAGELSILILDVDHFKPFNDTYGHLRGDNSLRLIAQVIDRAIYRTSDLAARYGGEEFACILPESGPHERVVAVAERILHGVSELAIPHSASPTADHVTISIGLISRRCTTDATPEDLLRLADQQLYLAKAGGRNRISSG